MDDPESSENHLSHHGRHSPFGVAVREELHIAQG
jgi:hypothetical protein